MHERAAAQRSSPGHAAAHTGIHGRSSRGGPCGLFWAATQFRQCWPGGQRRRKGGGRARQDVPSIQKRRRRGRRSGPAHTGAGRTGGACAHRAARHGPRRGASPAAGRAAAGGLWLRVRSGVAAPRSSRPAAAAAAPAPDRGVPGPAARCDLDKARLLRAFQNSRQPARARRCSRGAGLWLAAAPAAQGRRVAGGQCSPAGGCRRLYQVDVCTRVWWC
jgi:hypothetical protein